MLTVLGSLFILDISASVLIGTPADSLVLGLYSLSKLALLLVFLRVGKYRFKMRSPRPAWKHAFSGFAVLCGIFILNYISSFLPLGAELELFSPADGIRESLSIVFMVSVSVAFEEFAYRVYLLQALERAGAPARLAVLASSLLFSVGHLHMGLPGIVFSFTSAFLLCWLYYWGESFFTPFGVHLAYNLGILAFHGYY